MQKFIAKIASRAANYGFWEFCDILVILASEFKSKLQTHHEHAHAEKNPVSEKALAYVKNAYEQGSRLSTKIKNKIGKRPKILFL